MQFSKYFWSTQDSEQEMPRLDLNHGGHSSNPSISFWCFFSPLLRKHASEAAAASVVIQGPSDSVATRPSLPPKAHPLPKPVWPGARPTQTSINLTLAPRFNRNLAPKHRESRDSLRTSAVSPRHSIQRTWHLSRLLTLPHPENHHWAEKKINLKFSRKKDLSFYHFQATLQEIWSPACQPRPCFSTTTSFHLCGYI